MKNTSTLILFFSFLFFQAFSQTVFINEVNYLDPAPNNGFEIAGPVDKMIDGWDAFFYDINGDLIGSQSLSGTIPDISNGYGFIWVDVVLALDANPTAIGLADDLSNPVLLVSYGQTITPTSGIFNGLTSQLMGNQLVSLSSLQLSGQGNTYVHFNWNTPGGFTPGSLNTNQIFGTPLSLPASISYFDAYHEKNKVSLNWATSEERNSDYFSIERSKDGVSYTEIGQVNSITNSDILTQYEFTDEFPSSGLNYYRLKLISLSNDHIYSDVLQINFEKEIPKGIKLYPNPADDFIYLQPTFDLQGAFEIQILNGMNQSLKMQKFNDSNKPSIDISDLSPGIYFLLLKTNKEIYYQSFIKN